GKESKIFGSKTDYKVNCGPIGYNNDFKLVGIQMAVSNSNLYVGHISFTFEHM
ncbi:17016_t:CDS:1, partial [Racocetra persica]